MTEAAPGTTAGKMDLILPFNFVAIWICSGRQSVWEPAQAKFVLPATNYETFAVVKTIYKP